LVADRGLLSIDNIGELTAMADQDGRRLEFILAVPARRYGDLVETFQDLAFDDQGLAASTGASTDDNNSPGASTRRASPTNSQSTFNLKNMVRGINRLFNSRAISMTCRHN
jgi:hypothetical protein